MDGYTLIATYMCLVIGLCWMAHKRQKALKRQAATVGDTRDHNVSLPVPTVMIPNLPNPQNAVVNRQFITLPQRSFTDFIGQDRQIERLKAAIQVAQQRDTALPHMAFISSAGMGKTTLAACCATALNRKAVSIVGSAIQSMDDVAELVKQVGNGVVFIDEAHDLAKSDIPIVSGMLPLLEEWIMHSPTDSYKVEPFTCIMATTSFGMLDRALRSRMGIPYEFSPYTLAEMEQIGQVHAKTLDLVLDVAAGNAISERARGNPRLCRNLLVECHQMAVAGGQPHVNTTACTKAFDVLDIDGRGLSASDRRLLELLSSGPCSLYKCASYLGMDKKTFEETTEHFLFTEGYITTTSRGRSITDKGIAYVNS